MSKITAVCIGGPKDGVTTTVLHGRGFRCPVRGSVNTRNITEPTPQSMEKIEFAEYDLREFHTPGRLFHIFVLKQLSVAEAFDLLLRKYAS